MKEILKYKTFILLILAVLIVFILLSNNFYREAAIFWSLVTILVLLFKRTIVWLVYLLIINIFLFPSGGDFEESRLWSIYGFPVTLEKFLIIISPFALAYLYIDEITSILKNLFKSTRGFIFLNPTLSFMAFFIFLSAISIVISPVEIEKLRIALITLGFILFFVISLSFRKMKDIKIALIIITVGIILVSLYGLIEFALEINIFKDSTGFKPFPIGDIYRIKSTQGLPLILSSLINMLFPLVLVMAIYFRKSYAKFFFITGLIILTIAQIETFTRTGWLVMILESFVLLVVFRKQIIDLILGVVKSVPQGIFIGGVVLLATFVYLNSVNLVSSIDFRLTTDETVVESIDKNTGRVREITYGDANVTSFESRLQALELSRRVIVDRPILGVGLGGFTGAVKAYGQDLDVLKKFSAADNSYTMLMTETGLLGLMTFLAILVSLVKKSWGVYSSAKDKFYKNVALAILIAQFGVILQSIGFETFSYAHTMFIFLILSGSIFAYSRISSR